MTQLLALIVMMMAALHPGAEHTGQAKTIANAIAYVVTNDPAPEGWEQDEAAAVLIEMAWAESRFRMDVIGPAKCNDKGDCGAYGAWQAEHRPYLAKDPIAAARYEYGLIRAGTKLCHEHPLAMAIGGCYLYGSKKPNRVARDMSDKRMGEARRILIEAEGSAEASE